MPTINDIKDYHLDSESSIALLETIEISHPAWEKPVCIVTNHAMGFDALTEADADISFEFAPLLINKGKASDDLDQSLSITLGDLGEILSPLIQQIRDANSDEKPQVTYRAYAFDASTNQLANNKPIDVVKGLSISTMSRDHQATTFEATNTSKNTHKTGRTYNLRDYPDLSGNL